MTRFRLATYNVHKCKGIDLRVSPRRIADVIGEVKPDIIAAQEILHSQAEAISSDLNLPLTFGAVRHHRGEPYGNAVFTSLPVLSSETHDLTVGTREPRQCLRVSLALTPLQPIHLFAVHLGTSFFERREQARLLISAGILDRAEFGGSRILAGDFNEWTRGLATRLAGERLCSADLALHLNRRTTYPGLLPFLHLDHIYYDPLFRLRGMHLERTRLALLASDHLPLIADFELGDAAQSVPSGADRTQAEPRP
jgi:endonuclease/exonuclease/phosphatase family metal-dependent hydrolase